MRVVEREALFAKMEDILLLKTDRAVKFVCKWCHLPRSCFVAFEKIEPPCTRLSEKSI